MSAAAPPSALLNAPPEGPAAPEELEALARLGRRLVEVGLTHYAHALRMYYRDRRAGRDSLAWTPALTREWMAILRVPPYERDLEERPAGAPCPCCGDLPVHPPTLVVRGTSTSRCLRCGLLWLVVGRK